MSLDLFPGPVPPPDPAAPLAERMRPARLADVVGQEHLLGPGRFLARPAAALPSLILWGPPGSGKTTLARLLAARSGAAFTGLSAVAAGVREVRDVVAAARQVRRAGRRTVLFLDEIHRFNKGQQDSLLPHVESGLVTLLGATTENPSFEVNAALLSRCRVLVVKPLDEAALGVLLDRALGDPERGLGGRGVTLDPGARNALLRGADGDARRLLTALESAAELAASAGAGAAIGVEAALTALQASTLRHDRAGEEHFNLISALHKCVRAGDAQGAVYWTERMIAAGEDPLYVARRLVRMAVEDVGLADPDALPRTMAAQQAVHFLGLPEGGAALVQAAIYLSLAPKSNAVMVAEGEARGAIERTGSLPVPLVFRNAPTPLMKTLGYGMGYRYDHDLPDARSGQSGLPVELAESRFYRPTGRGFEAELERRLRDGNAETAPPEPGPGSTGRRPTPADAESP